MKAKVRLIHNFFTNYNGEIVEGEIDESGDFKFSPEDAEKYGSSWAMKGDYRVVDSALVVGGYSILIQAEDVTTVKDTLDALPSYMLDMITITKN